MSRLLLVLFAILAIFFASTSASSMRCPPNQEWDDCGTACPPTCENPDPKICTMNCAIGCRCRDGLLLNDRKECVLPRDCW